MNHRITGLTDPVGTDAPTAAGGTATQAANVTANVVLQQRDGNNNPLVAYTRGNDLSQSLEGAGGIGGLLARSHGYSGGNWSTHNFYHADGNGNVTYLVNSSQGLAASYRYDPFGNTLSKSGGLADANVYRFSSKEIHVNSGMYYYLYRFYDPSLQRWLNRDPIEELGGANLYRFARNSPVNERDALGLVSPECAAAMQELADAAANFYQSQGPLTYEIYEAALAAAVAACGPDLPPAPPPAPVTDTFPVCEPKPSPYRNPPGPPPPQKSFCQRHPNWCLAGVIAGGVAVVGGVTALCVSQPELCLGGIRVGIGVLRGAGTVLRGAGTVAAAGAG
jgi:RHS repeat-associated protein